jgi:hypothetical protein
MPVTQIGVIYATRSKMLQRVYIPDGDDSEIDVQHIHPGEMLIRVPIEVYRGGGADAVQALIGKPAHSGVCRVIHRHTGKIIDRIMADPDVYRHPDGHRVELDD